MDEFQAPAPQMPQSPVSLMKSAREMSHSKILAAIHGDSSPETRAAILERAHVCLALYFDADQTPETKSQVRAAFVRALEDLPLWVVLRGFEDWERSGTRRPSPAEVRMRAEAHLKPLTDELRRRREIKEREEEHERDRSSARCSKESASEIMARAGFTPARMDAVRKAPMASSMDEAEAAINQPPAPHWTETVAEDSAEMATLRAARAQNPLMQEMTASAARRASRTA